MEESLTLNKLGPFTCSLNDNRAPAKASDVDTTVTAASDVDTAAKQQIAFEFGPLNMTPCKFGPFTFEVDDGDDYADTKMDEEVLARLCSQMDASNLESSSEQKQNICLVAAVDAAVDEYYRLIDKIGATDKV